MRKPQDDTDLVRGLKWRSLMYTRSKANITRIIFTVLTYSGVARSAVAPEGCVPRDMGLVGLKGSKISLSGNAFVMAADAYLLSGSPMSLSGKAEIQGAVFVERVSTVKTSGRAVVDDGERVVDLSSTAKYFSDLGTYISSLPANQIRSGITSAATISVPGSELNVLQVNGDIKLSGQQQLTLSGGKNSIVIVRVSGNIHVSGQASIILKGGLIPSHVLFYNSGYGSDASVTGKGGWSGTYFAPQRGISLTGNGKMWGLLVGSGRIDITGNGFLFNAEPFCVDDTILPTPTPTPTPTPGGPPVE